MTPTWAHSYLSRIFTHERLTFFNQLTIRIQCSERTLLADVHDSRPRFAPRDVRRPPARRAVW